MGKRRCFAWLLFLVSILMLTTLVVPHHHHNAYICFIEFETHITHTDSCHHHADGFNHCNKSSNSHLCTNHYQMVRLKQSVSLKPIAIDFGNFVLPFHPICYYKEDSAIYTFAPLKIATDDGHTKSIRMRAPPAATTV